MDNVTHALAGILIGEAALARRSAASSTAPFRRAALVLGVVTAELPDADLLYANSWLGMGQLGYLLHHRGHTHTVVFAVVAALLAWGATLALRRGTDPRTRGTLLGVALAGTLSHLLLDWTNNYGVHPFWPVDNRWYYGDAVFIVEPWLWVAALGPLLFLARGRVARTLYALALLAILAAAWRMPMVGRGVALAVTVGAAVWFAASRFAPPTRRVALAFVGWGAVEIVFIASSHAARAEVRSLHRTATLLDVSLSPAVGDPTCFRALVVEREGATYRATAATVASFPRLRDARRCGAFEAVGAGAVAPPYRDTDAVRWGSAWEGDVAELRDLAARDCVAAAALRFHRVPGWRRTAERAALWDFRYDDGSAGGFTMVETHTGAPCPRWVPPWIPPRSDLLDGGDE